MKKYSREWKQKTKKWVQKHTRLDRSTYWSIHYIQNDMEYSNGEYPSEKSAKEDLINYTV